MIDPNIKEFVDKKWHFNLGKFHERRIFSSIIVLKIKGINKFNFSGYGKLFILLTDLTDI